MGDGSHTYTWDAAGKSLSVDSVNLTFDALGRMVEQNRSGSYTEILYGPGGAKLALMNGQTLTKGLIGLPGGGQAVYNSSGLLYYGHSDHLGSAKLGSTPSRAMYFDLAYAPFGEVYATSGSTDPAFTGQRQDTVAGLFDFPDRQYSTQGRWPTPDPSGLASVNLHDPQQLNRYAYVRNNPLANVDPNGLVCNGADIYSGYPGDPLANGTGIFTPEDCTANGGTWTEPTSGPDPTSGGDPSDSGNNCNASDPSCGDPAPNQAPDNNQCVPNTVGCNSSGQTCVMYDSAGEATSQPCAPMKEAPCVDASGSDRPCTSSDDAPDTVSNLPLNQEPSIPPMTCDVSGCHPMSGQGLTKEGGCALAAGVGTATLLLVPGLDVPLAVQWAVWGSAFVTTVIGWVCAQP